jgi:hypothetical protein
LKPVAGRPLNIGGGCDRESLLTLLARRDWSEDSSNNTTPGTAGHVSFS